TDAAMSTPRRAGPGPSADATGSQGLDRLGDPALPRLVGLGALDLADVPRLVAVRERIEHAAGVRGGVERLGEVVRFGDDAGRRIELDVDVDDVTTRDSGGLPDVRADPD